MIENGRPLRIGFGRFMQETNSFSSVLTTKSDFKHFITGNQLLEACKPGQWEIKGFLKNMELTGFYKAVERHRFHRSIEIFPLISAFAIPGGPLKKDDFYYFLDCFIKKIEGLELDALFLSLHGALDVEDMENAEVYFIDQLKKQSTNKLKIAVTLDLHATLTQAMVDATDIICAYRTNPHRDYQKTGYKAADMLIRTLLGEINPYVAWRSLPMIQGGGAGVDFLAPMFSLFARMDILEANFGVLNANIYMCHPFIKHPNIGWSTYIITNNQREEAEKWADELAEKCWNLRFIEAPRPEEISQVLQKAKRSFIARKLGTITICDSSDVVGAGGTGENTEILKWLLQEGKGLLSYVPLRDAEAVMYLWDLDLGSEIKLAVGGKLQPEFNQPLDINGKILFKKSTRDFGRIVVMDLEHVKLVITEDSALAIKPNFYSRLGLNAWKPDITVVKSFFHFRIYYLFISRKTYYVKTKGITDTQVLMDIVTNDPVFPKDKVDDWRAIDIKRRSKKN